MENSSLIPGFRFHPTDHELVMYYLKRKLLGKRIIVNAVAEVNIYDFSPWDLPDKSSLKSGDLEWYFFCPKSKKYLTGARANRATEKGYWKATGKDRKVEYRGRTVATIKTLVFHLGHASSGERTNWVMHEYNMNDEKLADQGIIQDMYALCKIFEKEGAGPKNGAQYGAPFKEEEWDDEVASSSLTGPGPVVGPDGPTNKLDYKQKGKASVSLTEPGSSTVTYAVTENVTPVDNPFNDDVMFLEDIEAVLGVPTCNNEIKGVNEDDIFDDLVNLVNLEELNGGDELKDDVAKYAQEMFMGVDDLDADLEGFYVD